MIFFTNRRVHSRKKSVITIPSNQMVCLYKVGLFTGVPIDESLTVIREKMAANSLPEEHTNIHLENQIKILTFCRKDLLRDGVWYIPTRRRTDSGDSAVPTYSSCVRTRDVTLKTCRRRWMIGRNGERRSGISAQAARHDDDDTRNTSKNWPKDHHHQSHHCELDTKMMHLFSGCIRKTF